MTDIRIGTSAFTAAGWEGAFYPADMKPTDDLTYYASRFATVEVDSTFYATPSASTVMGWARKTPDTFVFALKVRRDTFAVNLAQAGVSLENVSTLLGHQSIRITQKHYSPWIKTRQDALDRELIRVNSAMPQEQNRNN